MLPRLFSVSQKTGTFSFLIIRSLTDVGNIIKCQNLNTYLDMTLNSAVASIVRRVDHT